MSNLKDSQISLNTILNSYTEGKVLLKLHKIKTELPELSKQVLVDKIVDYFIQKGHKLNVPAAETITQQIKRLFPDEPTVTN